MIPELYGKYVEVGPNAEGRAQARLNGWADEWMKPNLIIKAGTPGWSSGIAALLEKSHGTCGRAMNRVSYCNGICELQSREIEIPGGAEFDPSRSGGVHVKNHPIIYQEVI